MIYLTRHGQTEWNREGRYQGKLDSPLTPHGEQQARRVGALLASLIDAPGDWRLVTSPLGRARRTAELIRDSLDGRVALDLDDRLAEISLGSWDGLSYDEVESLTPDGLGRWERYFHSPDGETYDALAARVADWLAQVSGSVRLIVVSHGVTGRVLRGLYAGLTRDEMLKLDVPQDAVFRLVEGAIDRLDCAQVQ